MGNKSRSDGNIADNGYSDAVNPDVAVDRPQCRYGGFCPASPHRAHLESVARGEGAQGAMAYQAEIARWMLGTAGIPAVTARSDAALTAVDTPTEVSDAEDRSGEPWYHATDGRRCRRCNGLWYVGWSECGMPACAGTGLGRVAPPDMGAGDDADAAGAVDPRVDVGAVARARAQGAPRPMREGPGARVAATHGRPGSGQPARPLTAARTPTAWAEVFELLDRCSLQLQQARRIAQRDRDAARLLVALQRVDDAVSEVRDAALEIDSGERWEVFGPGARFRLHGVAYEVVQRGPDDGVCGLRTIGMTGDEHPKLVELFGPAVVKLGASTDQGIRALVGVDHG